jgi:hypothetical protein
MIQLPTPDTEVFVLGYDTKEYLGVLGINEPKTKLNSYILWNKESDAKDYLYWFNSTNKIKKEFNVKTLSFGSLLTQAVDIGTLLVYNPKIENAIYTICVIPDKDNDIFVLNVSPDTKIARKTVNKIKGLIKTSSEPIELL